MSGGPTCRACPACMAPLSEMAVALSAATGVPMACLECGAASVGAIIRGEAFPVGLPDAALAEEHPQACLDVAAVRSALHYRDSRRLN